MACLAILLGIPAGVGLYTFTYAEGLSYLSNDPRACVNCHIMTDQYESWVRSSHHEVATCNDCHVPTDLIGKYFAKASNGWHHSSGFTLQSPRPDEDGMYFHEPIMIKPANSQILQDNCLRCHGDFVHDIVGGSSYAEDAVRCVHCHFTVGHGPRGYVSP